MNPNITLNAPTPGLVLHRHRHLGQWQQLGCRPTRWGNPFTHKPNAARGTLRVANLQAAIGAFDAWLNDDQEALDPYLPGDLKGKMPFLEQRADIQAHCHLIYGQKVACYCVREPTLPDAEPMQCHVQSLLRFAHHEHVKSCTSAALSALSATAVTLSK